MAQKLETPEEAVAQRERIYRVFGGVVPIYKQNDGSYLLYIPPSSGDPAELTTVEQVDTWIANYYKQLLAN